VRVEFFLVYPSPNPSPPHRNALSYLSLTLSYEEREKVSLTGLFINSEGSKNKNSVGNINPVYQKNRVFGMIIFHLI
jgi:hypothetical protein